MSVPHFTRLAPMLHHSMPPNERYRILPHGPRVFTLGSAKEVH